MSNTMAEATASLSSDCAPCPGKPVLERIPTRPAEVGEGLVIHRALPNRQRRMVGAWCFLDHAGPIEFPDGQGLNVGPHPHIGLQTFTWMIEGEVLHRDSLGYEQLVRPGQVNLMTAGNGIAHAEHSVGTGGRLHAAQLWIALPEDRRHMAPAFQNYPDLPSVTSGGFDITVLAGTAFGQTSPVAVHSPLVGMDLATGQAASTAVPADPAFEYAALTLSGEAVVEGEVLGPDTLLYLGTGRQQIAVRSDGAAELLLIGGVPFGEGIVLWWNFVARNAAEIEAATHDWNSGSSRFGEVAGDVGARLVAPDVTGMHLKPQRR
ncbi:quercetin 2,3-dioxygenase PA1205 (plasmid) [Cupriavidus necator N-1]|uniref:Quercetin 2,3-dioxygenase PA1205 n=1 Tax=Cupriavidus necator (strain ATCC 43291 / DSM 13513 / CCUG 52238 / LMG 8453 / N-1) TaxID=1042878 RepID=F8GYB0_CUPNN|nr:pirin family protein [Cupriavidus necator]AEI82851.1 quercetin 2,3-dioxygenase PA1205 [Cupriavidus necator N-1]MDX6008649.1 pirin family protein [Cupriavidus necator]